MSRPSARFLSQLAHDLRSPLNVIGSTLTELAHETGLTTADREQIVSLSQRAVGRLISLSDRLALASRLELPFEVVLSRADLAQITPDTVALFVPSQMRPRIKVVTTYSQTPVPIRVDLALFRVLVLELLTNANRFARRQFSVEVSMTADAATLTIDDDGEGVKEDERALLFEPFAERRSRTGLGMGLWLAGRLAELQKGTLVVEHLSQGTRQRLTLPIDK